LSKFIVDERSLERKKKGAKSPWLSSKVLTERREREWL